MIEQQIILAIQKPSDNPQKPNMGDESVTFLQNGGLSFTFESRIDDTSVKNIKGLRILQMKNADLARAVGEGEADFAILGLDMNQESSRQQRAIILQPLGFSNCSLNLCVREEADFVDPANLAGLRIATSYVNITQDFFRRIVGVNVIIRPYQGGEEGAVKRGTADACVVISEKGTSVEKNDLRILKKILDSEATLFANPDISEKKGSERIAWRFFRSVMTGLWKTQYTLLKANFRRPLTDEALAILPCAESPTILSLQSGGQAVELLVPINGLTQLVDELQNKGASSVVTVDKVTRYPDLNDSSVTRMMRAIYGNTWNPPVPHFSI